MLEKIQETSNEVVIALVGAVGSSPTPLTNKNFEGYFIKVFS